MPEESYVDIVIDTEGNASIELHNFSGRECEGQVDDLIKALGVKTSTEKKKEYRGKVKNKGSKDKLRS